MTWQPDHRSGIHVPAACSEPHLRFLMLVNDLGTQMGFLYGWQTEAAKRLGIDRAVINGACHGKRLIGSLTLARALANFRGEDQIKLPRDCIVGGMATKAGTRVPDDFDLMRSVDAMDESRRKAFFDWARARFPEDV